MELIAFDVQQTGFLREVDRGSAYAPATTDSDLLRMVKALEPAKPTAPKSSPVAATEPVPK